MLIFILQNVFNSTNFRKQEKKIIYRSLLILNEFRLNICRHTLIVEISLFYLYYYFCPLKYFPFKIDKNQVQRRKNVLRKHYRTIEIIAFCGNDSLIRICKCISLPIPDTLYIKISVIGIELII